MWIPARCSVSMLVGGCSAPGDLEGSAGGAAWELAAAKMKQVKAKTLDIASWFTRRPFAVPGGPAGAPGQPIVVEPPWRRPSRSWCPDPPRARAERVGAAACKGGGRGGNQLLGLRRGRHVAGGGGG